MPGRRRARGLPFPVANRSFARRHWPDGNAVGRRIVTFRGAWEIVGVVADTRELTSLGATRGDLVSMVMRQGTILAFVGIAIGVGVALAATRGLARFLFGVSPFDPMTFGGVAGVLLLAALVATFFTALRAARVDPVVALRTE